MKVRFSLNICKFCLNHISSVRLGVSKKLMSGKKGLEMLILH